MSKAQTRSKNCVHDDPREDGPSSIDDNEDATLEDALSLAFLSVWPTALNVNASGIDASSIRRRAPLGENECDALCPCSSSVNWNRTLTAFLRTTGDHENSIPRIARCGCSFDEGLENDGGGDDDDDDVEEAKLAKKA